MILTLILDNAPFHRKDDVFEIVEQAGHSVLFLPPYSPIKKRRIYEDTGGEVASPP
jgi:transposase